MIGQAFKTFPEFSKLTLADKKVYDKWIKEHPAIADISFGSLMAWWNQLEDGISISQLNGNLVLPYWLPGNEKDAGLSLVGTNQVDESICTIFDYLREKGDPVKLVNVPELVVSSIRYPDMFSAHEQRGYHEYIIPVSQYYPLKNVSDHRKRKIERQLRRIGEENVVVKSLDLRSTENKQLLLQSGLTWWRKNLSSLGKIEREAMKKAILHPNELGMENVCLFINDDLRGFCLYQIPSDKRFVILNHVKATHKAFLGFELICYEFAKWFADRGITYVNLNSDEGILPLRMFMLTLGPTNFFRKYTITPVGKV